MSGFVDWLGSLGQRFSDWAIDRARRQSDPESLIAALIATIWAVLASIEFGVLAILVVVGITWMLHGLTVEAGQHSLLWITTGLILMMILVALPVTLGATTPLPTAMAGCTALIYNEAVRFNYTHRRGAAIGRTVAPASGLAVGSAAALALVGVAAADIVDNQRNQNWLWMFAALVALLLVGYAFTLVPGRKAPGTSSERWQPGERIPPQPLGRQEFDDY